jgi:hypothetical protein
MQLTARRLPGIRFENAAPPTPQVLPRMDIAGFVGFASSGPLNVPVPIEDPAHFAEIFGPDAPLAWDPERGEQAHAYLGPAVRAFFRNGGVRCWVVRVAALPSASPPHPNAVIDRFPVGGVAELGADGELRQALLTARSSGSWADSLTLSSALAATPLRIGSVDLGAAVSCEAFLGSPQEVAVGDLVRVAFPESPWSLLFAVAAIDTSAGPAVVFEGARLQPAALEAGIGLFTCATSTLGAAAGSIDYLGAGGAYVSIAATPVAATSPELVTLALDVPPAEAAPSGSLVHGLFGAQEVWIDVAAIEPAGLAGSLLRGTAFLATRSVPPSLPARSTGPLSEKLELQLRVENGVQEQTVLTGLGFAPGHALFLGDLPSDEVLYGTQQDLASAMVEAVSSPRFPLAAPTQPPALYLPLAASILPGPSLPALLPPGSERLRDGLDKFDASVFLDGALAGVGVGRLLAEANWIHDQAPQPRALQGIHALLEVEEVTIVSVPDAVQREWLSSAGGGPETTYEASREEPPGADPAEFVACGRVVPAQPSLSLEAEPGVGTFTLGWTATDAPDAIYELQQATLPDLSDAAALYVGRELHFSLFGRPPGSTLRFRVRALNEQVAGAWSQTLVVATPSPERWLMIAADRYDSNDLLATQVALLEMCAARGDMLAVLSLPEHYRERAAAAHVAALKSEEGTSADTPNPIFCFGAAYHPWLYAVDPAAPGSLRATPPEGAAAGVIAARAGTGGPWLAPANVPLSDVVALDPPIGAEAYGAMQQARVNLVRETPKGFLCLAAETLSDSPELVPIGVRRLLSALRRLALLRGTAYAFEPNDDSLRRTVQRDLELLLGQLLALGAFAGATPAESFRVSTATQADAGRLIVDVAVAPSLPLSFLTVRVKRGADGSLSVEGP